MEKKKEKNCMVCGDELNYLTEPIEKTCYFCGKKEESYFLCSNEHFVCESCHSSESFEAVKKIALETTLKNPNLIAQKMMKHPSVPMIGCEHAFIASASLSSALKNSNKVDLSNEDIIDSMKRSNEISKSGYCSLSGNCGIACGIASVFSVILGSTCEKDKELSKVLHVHSEITKSIAATSGPSCCKRFLKKALLKTNNLLKIFLDIKLEEKPEDCSFKGNHSHCIEKRCEYF